MPNTVASPAASSRAVSGSRHSEDTGATRSEFTTIYVVRPSQVIAKHHRKTSRGKCRLSDIFGFTGYRKPFVLKTFK
jgi:hypothetical protein